MHPGLAPGEIQCGSHGDMELFAKWQPVEYTITYNLNGGSLAEGAQNSYTIEDLPLFLKNPVRDDYSFSGWYKTDDYSSEKLNFITDISDKPIILYAKWNHGLTVTVENLETFNSESYDTIILEGPFTQQNLEIFAKRLEEI